MDEADKYYQLTDFEWFQIKCNETAIYPKDTGIMYTTLGLTNEAGEFAGKVKKGIRDGIFDKEGAVSELFDVLWYVAQCATELDVSLEDVVYNGIKKLQDRQERGVLGGNGDHR